MTYVPFKGLKQRDWCIVSPLTFFLVEMQKRTVKRLNTEQKEAE